MDENLKLDMWVLLKRLEKSVKKFEKAVKKGVKGSFTASVEILLRKIGTNIDLAKKAVKNKEPYFIVSNIEAVGKDLLKLERGNVLLAKKETFVEMEDLYVELSKLCKKLK